MRKSSINEMLDEVKETYLLIKEYKKVPRPKVNTMLWLLRSCLDYASKDISSKLIKPKLKPYFPYASTIQQLDGEIQKQLPNLKIEMPKIWDEIVNLHNFPTDGAWLKSLCDLTNLTKHNDPFEVKSETERVKDVSVDIDEINLFRVGGDSVLIVEDTFVKGKKIDDFKINKGGISISQKGEMPIRFKLSKDKKIIIGDENIDLFPFLDTCIFNIESFSIKLYEILEE